MVGPTGKRERAADGVLVFRHDFADAFRFHQCPLRLPNDFGANRGWHDRFVGTFKESHIEFLLQFHEHGAECWLRNTASLGRLRKIAEAVEGNDISELLQIHAGGRLLEAI